jgi:hypothetical protein
MTTPDTPTPAPATVEPRWTPDTERGLLNEIALTHLRAVAEGALYDEPHRVATTAALTWLADQGLLVTPEVTAVLDRSSSLVMALRRQWQDDALLDEERDLAAAVDALEARRTDPTGAGT